MSEHSTAGSLDAAQIPLDPETPINEIRSQLLQVDDAAAIALLEKFFNDTLDARPMRAALALQLLVERQAGGVGIDVGEEIGQDLLRKANQARNSRPQLAEAVSGESRSFDAMMEEFGLAWDGKEYVKGKKARI